MDLEPQKDGHLHFKLGPVEKWLVTGSAAALLVVCGLYGRVLLARLDKVEVIDDRTIVIVQQIDDMKKTLDAVPATLAAHTIQLTEHTEQIKSIKDDQLEMRNDITELQKIKGLR